MSFSMIIALIIDEREDHSMSRIKVDYTRTGKTVQHGMASSYNNHRCRCEECTNAWTKYIHDRGYVKKYHKKKRLEELEKTRGTRVKF